MITVDSLIKDLMVPSFSRTVSEMNRDQILGKFGQDVASMYGYDQKNPHHCYDLLTHTARTVDGISRKGVKEDEFAILRIAAMYHDIGKIKTAAWSEKKSRLTYYGHAKASAALARDFFSDIGMEPEMKEQICFLIRHHDDFIDVMTAKRLARVIDHNIKTDKYQASRRDYILLMNLCIADASAQAETVWEDGTIIATRQAKIKNYSTIAKLIRQNSYLKNTGKIPA